MPPIGDRVSMRIADSTARFMLTSAIQFGKMPSNAHFASWDCRFNEFEQYRNRKMASGQFVIVHDRFRELVEAIFSKLNRQPKHFSTSLGAFWCQCRQPNFPLAVT